MSHLGENKLSATGVRNTNLILLQIRNQIIPVKDLCIRSRFESRYAVRPVAFQSAGRSRCILDQKGRRPIHSRNQEGKSWSRYTSQTTLQRQTLSLFKGSWALPGGHLEHGESFEICGQREVAEETGIYMQAEDMEYLTTTNSVWQKEKLHYVTIFMACYVSGDAEAQVRVSWTMDCCSQPLAIGTRQV
jgi:ADP-ribose pyrophosphatase YjhB (NUDIX family)